MILRTNLLAKIVVVSGWLASNSVLGASLAETLSENRFWKMKEALEATQLLNVLNDTPDLTIFVPNDGAFARFERKIEALAPTERALIRVLQTHVLDRVYTPEQFRNASREFETLAGTTVGFSPAFISDPPRIGNARLSIDGSRFEAIPYENGVIYQVFDVITPKPLPSGVSSVSEVLQNDPRFSTFVDLLDSTGLTAEVFSGENGTVTILAPTEEAFASLDPDVLAELVQNPARLGKILLGHISFDGIEGTFTTTYLDFTGYAGWNTGLNFEQQTQVRRRGNLDDDFGVFVYNGTNNIPAQGIRITVPDIAANDGVIHGIDEVIPLYELPFYQ